MTQKGIFKVVPAGVIDSKRLRATVMISPTVGSDDLPMLPSSLVDDWLQKKWKLKVIKLRSSGEECPMSFEAAIKKVESSGNKGNCDAKWAAGAAAWSTGNKTWLNKLWCDSFRDKEGKLPNDAWGALYRSLKSSNEGTAIQPGESLTKLAKQAREEGTKIQAILPSRQSDLAMLLESERALEICCTAKWAHGDFTAYEEEENRCLGLISCTKTSESDRSHQEAPSTPPSPENANICEAQIELRTSTKKRFEDALDTINAQYQNCAQAQSGNASAPWLLDPASYAGNREELAKAIPNAVRSHQAANPPEQYSGEKADADVMRIYFAIQGSPALSRLFGLTLDLEIARDALNRALELSPGTRDSEETVVHLLLGIVADGESNEQVIWTLVRYRPAGEGHFFPASRLELSMPANRNVVHPLASEYEGVIVLGQSYECSPCAEPRTPKSHVSRFVLSSLDVQRATNGALDRMALSAKEATQEPPPEPLLACKPNNWARKTHSTAGLVLLDRGRVEQAITQFAARDRHLAQPQIVVLDSNDLLLGYRLDVGVPAKNPSLGQYGVAWRGLMARKVVHGAESNAPITRITRLLMGGTASKASAWQQTLEDAQLSLPARLVPTTADQTQKKSNSKDAYVEEIVAVWTGEPMGAQCVGKDSDKKAEVPVGGGQIISLPTSNDDANDRLPPPLRFGWPYRVGLRAVYAGSISLPMQRAQQLYEGVARYPKENALALPAREKNRSGIRRFLRHERISSPYLLMHSQIALRSNYPMGYERSGHAIIRSVDEGKHGDRNYADRGQPETTQRIFVPPSVEMHFAAMHGVFDKNPQSIPPQGLPGVRFDAKAGGFPFVFAPSIEGINGETFDGKRTISTELDQAGDAVYEERAGGEHERYRRYYPDPAAVEWVIAVRHTGTNNYLGGKPVTTPVRAEGSYPHCRPLVLKIVRDKSPRYRGACPSLNDVLSHPTVRQTSPRVNNSVEIVVTLAPGDDFDIDVWCIPDEKALANWFAPIENIGTLALLNARRAGNEDSPSPEQFLVALETMLPQAMVHVCKNSLKAYGCWPKAETSLALQGNDGVGGLPAPGRLSRLAIAAALHDTLTARPLEEIAAVQTLRVTHATLRPFRLPAFLPAEAQNQLCLRRPIAAGSPGDTTAENKVEYVLVGEVLVDLVTTGAIEFRAKTAFPNSSTFDDPRRGRSVRDRRNGKWPEYRGHTLAIEQIFGFGVAADGRVTLCKSSISLLQIVDLATPLSLHADAEDDGMWRLNLKELSSAAESCGWGRITARHIFPDRKARQLFVSMVARPRHELLMRTASRVSKLGGWLRPSRDAVEPIAKDLPEVSIWLPAGIRPSEPIAVTPIPAFIWTNPSPNTVRRSTAIRILLGRGWFSSGEGERLGIVVWPPGSLNAVTGHLPPPEVPSLPDFMDEDLGPGGRFVTRWGSDPTKKVDDAASAFPGIPGFLEPSSFKDIDPESPTKDQQNCAKLIELAHMPVLNGASDGQDEDSSPQVTLDVSLVTYEPRFDVETEQWYVDASIEHPFEAQPFVRLGLVRFQPNAPEDLQVSFPTTQWVQLLPRRDIHVDNILRDGKEFARVTVEGLGPLEDEFDAANDRVGTRVLAHLMSEYINDSGITCHSILLVAPMEISCLPEGPMRPEGYRGPRRRWSIDIDLDLLPIGLGSNAPEKITHYVYIEEREAYLPATYVHEPVTPPIASGGLEPSMHQESGPRFLARIALNKQILRTKH